MAHGGKVRSTYKEEYGDIGILVETSHDVLLLAAGFEVNETYAVT